MKEKNFLSKKGQYIMMLIGIIACIVSIIMVITNPEVSTYQEFFRRSLVSIMLLISFIFRSILLKKAM